MNVRYGLADILGYMNSVRFAPESRHSAIRLKTAALCQKRTFNSMARCQLWLWSPDLQQLPAMLIQLFLDVTT
jgi:hypothetical protein